MEFNVKNSKSQWNMQNSDSDVYYGVSWHDSWMSHHQNIDSSQVFRVDYRHQLYNRPNFCFIFKVN